MNYLSINKKIQPLINELRINLFSQIEIQARLIQILSKKIYLEKAETNLTKS